MLYKWAKYTVKYIEPSWPLMPQSSVSMPGEWSGYSDYIFDEATGKFKGTGTATISSASGPYYGTLYTISEYSITRFTFGGTTSDIPPKIKYSAFVKATDLTRGTQGDFVDEVLAENEDAYPHGAVQDGYFYVYIGEVSRINGYVNVGGTAKKIDAVYVNIDGSAKTVTSIYCNINGVASQST